ncbi:hypothetical protein ACFL6C_01365 [Myxococcota bacterium]
MFRLPLLVFLLSAVVASCASTTVQVPEPATPPTYVVKLHRRSHIGEMLDQHVVMTAVKSMVVKAGDTIMQQQRDEMNVTFSATLKVVDVDERGTATKIEYVIDELVAESGNERKELLESGGGSSRGPGGGVAFRVGGREACARGGAGPRHDSADRGGHQDRR